MRIVAAGVMIGCVLAWTATGCGSASVAVSPTPPAGPPPRIDTIAPSLPIEKDGPQRMTIHAENFGATTILYVTAPDQTVDSFTGPTIQHLAVDYEVFMTLSQVGYYVLTARNADGGVSAPFTLTVGERPKPSIGSVTPTALTTSTDAQIVTVIGAGFEPGLTATVVNGLDGTVVGGDAITGLTPTTFDLHFAFRKAGHYAINLVNLAGDVSNTVGVDVTGVAVRR